MRTLTTAAVVVFVLTAPAGAAACDPQVLDFGALPGQSRAEIDVIGPRGLMGGSSRAADGSTLAVLWRDGSIADMGVEGFVADIEARGDVLVQGPHDFETFTGSAYVQPRGGTLEPLPGLGGDWVWARRMNERGDVAGSASDAQGVEHAVHWRHGRPVDRGVPASYGGAYARGINERGDLVGAAYGAEISTPWIWRADGTSGPLDPGFPDRNGSGDAFVIDDQGRAAGVSGPFFEPFGEATIWTRDGLRRGLGTFPGDDFSVIVGTNGQGDWIGGSGAPDSRVLLTDGRRLLTMRSLDGDPSGFSLAHAITRRRSGDVDVGGTSDAGDGRRPATLWRCAYTQAFGPPGDAPDAVGG